MENLLPRDHLVDPLGGCLVHRIDHHLAASVFGDPRLDPRFGRAGLGRRHHGQCGHDGP